MAIILGIDPGSRVTGFGIIECTQKKYYYITSGHIKLSHLQMSERLFQIFKSVSQIIQQYSPQHAAIEKVFMHKNPDSALKLGQARGAALAAMGQHGLSIKEYSPRLIKQSVVGYGGSDKKQVQFMVKLLLSLSDVPQSDAADALAIALCHANYNKETNE